MNDLVGLKALIFLGWMLALSGCGTFKAIQNSESGAAGEAFNVWSRWVDSRGDIAAATTWERKVEEGVTVAEVEQAFASVAAEDNIKMVGEFFVSRELEGRSGMPERFLKIYSFCSPSVAKEMIDFSPHMAAFMPCRISLLEKEDGLWLYSMNMDLLIKMGRKLPPELRKSAYQVRESIWKMMERGARGDF